MNCRHGPVRSLCVTAALLILPLGGVSAIAADDPTSPTTIEGIESLIAEKLDLLASLEKPTTASAPSNYSKSGEESDHVVQVRPFLEREVDCDKGQSVNRIISNHPARQMILHLSGTCRESVVVDRPGVTLTGARAGTAVIDPPDDEGGTPIGPAIYALGAHELTLEDLTLTGGTHGLEAHASRRMQLTRVNAVENQVCPDCPWGPAMGIILNGSEAVIVDSNLSSNNAPLLARLNSSAGVFDTIMENNDDGPFSTSGSNLSLNRCTVRNNGWGPQAVTNSITAVRNSTVEFPGNAGVSFAWGSSHLYLQGTEINGELWAVHGSFLELGGTVNLDGAIAVVRSSAAFIDTDGVIHGPVTVNKFSDAYIETEQAIDGAIHCNDRSSVICNLNPTGGIHGCE